MKKWIHRLVIGGLGVLCAGLTAGADEGALASSWVFLREGRAGEVAPGAVAPESLGDVSGLLYQGAAGETAAQMKTVLFAGEGPEAVETEMGRREKALNGYRVVHGLWRSPETVLVSAFEGKAEKGWGVHLGVWSEGASREQRATEINRWFGEQTRGTVGEVIGADALDESTAFCGVLLAVFAAPWAGDVFAFGGTRREIFYASAEERFEVTMMAGAPWVEYAEDEDFQFVRIGYAGSTLGLHLLLPKRAPEGPETLAKADGRRWQTLAAAAKRRTVRLRLPKVDVREHIDWRERLGTEFGLDRPFTAGAADFSNLARHPAGPLYLGTLRQSVWVRWDERGTRAEAVTVYAGQPFGDSSEPVPDPGPVFVANHPFAYVIGDVAQGRVLFAGRIGRREQMPAEDAR